LENDAGWWDQLLMERIEEAEFAKGGKPLDLQELLAVAQKLLDRMGLGHLVIHPKTK
jgi:hypothetical protein